MEIKGNINAGYDNIISGGAKASITKSSIVGGENNHISTTGATSYSFNTIVGGRQNSSLGVWGFIGAGASNYLGINSYRFNIPIGSPNPTEKEYGSFIGGGMSNKVYGSFNSVIGGYSNNISSFDIRTTIVGGYSNATYTSNPYSVIDISRWGSGQFIGGGTNNEIYGSIGLFVNQDALSRNSAIVGGRDNYIGSSDSSFIGGGRDNAISGESKYSSIVGGQLNRIDRTKYSGVVVGKNNLVESAYYSAVVSGNENQINSDGFLTFNQFIGSGKQNKILGNSAGNVSNYSSIVGGQLNRITASTHSIIGGGYSNTITYNGKPTQYNSISGGKYNKIYNSYSSFIGAGQFNYLSNCGPSEIVGGYGNRINGDTFTNSIVGGFYNKIEGSFGNFIGNGSYNNITGTTYSSISGGYRNNINDSVYTFIGGGLSNTINNYNYSTILGGQNNTVNHKNAHIIGSNITSVAIDTTYVENLNIGDGLSIPSDNVSDTGGTTVNLTTSDYYVRSTTISGNTIYRLPTSPSGSNQSKDGQVLVIASANASSGTVRITSNVAGAILQPNLTTDRDTIELTAPNANVTLYYDGGINKWVVTSETGNVSYITTI